MALGAAILLFRLLWPAPVQSGGLVPEWWKFTGVGGGGNKELGQQGSGEGSLETESKEEHSSPGRRVTYRFCLREEYFVVCLKTYFLLKSH